MRLDGDILNRVSCRRDASRARLGILKLFLVESLSLVLAAPRAFYKAIGRKDNLDPRPLDQMPWLLHWPALRAVPRHDEKDFAWSKILIDGADAIRHELKQITDSFEKARYDSELNPKPWMTYYFFLHGKPITDHLKCCPRTAAILKKIPHNGFHVCFSAISAASCLVPHTGPTNTSLTLHLGLENCLHSYLTVSEHTINFQDGNIVLFDDSFVHSATNAGNKTRYTLMVTIWHPELNALERAILLRIAKIMR